jgi:hypothetical protein
MSARKLGLAVTAVAVALPAAHAFNTGYGWRDAVADIRISTASFPVGSQQLAAAEAAMEDWNRVQGSAFRFRYTSQASSGALDHGDRLNGVAFSSQVGGSTLGITFSTDSGGRRISADVLFNPATRWIFDGSPSQNEWDFGSTARHEYGHALGIEHSNMGCSALMGASCGRNGTVRQIRADDANAVRFLYPGAPASTVDWRVTTLTAQPTSARPGQSVNLSIILTNSGNSASQGIPARLVVLSTNSTISTQDRVLTTLPATSQSIGANQQVSQTVAVQVPATTNPGSYYLGVYVDPQDTVEESLEDNNTRWATLAITSPAPAPAPAPTPPPAPAPAPAPALSDWALTNVTVTPRAITAGDPITVTWSARCSNATATSLPEVRLVLSDNATITNRDAPIAFERERAGPFAVGQVLTGTFTARLSPAAGTYVVGVLLDPENVSQEADEGNDARGESITVSAPAPAATPAPTPASTPPPAPAPAPTGSTAAAATPAPSTTSTAAETSSGGGGGCALTRPSTPSTSDSAPAVLALVGLVALTRRRA